MQFTLRATRRTPHGASRLVQAMSVWLVKPRRAPSRHSRGARVYGHTTTAMHKLRTPPPPLPHWMALVHVDGAGPSNFVFEPFPHRRVEVGITADLGFPPSREWHGTYRLKYSAHRYYCSPYGLVPPPHFR